MDTLSLYRTLVRDIILRYAKVQPAVGDVESEIVFDEAQDHYALMSSGWVNGYRIHGSVLHVDIRGGKIWIQHDGTEEGIAEALVAGGVPRDHIVLAFKAPEARKYTDYAVA